MGDFLFKAATAVVTAFVLFCVLLIGLEITEYITKTTDVGHLQIIFILVFGTFAVKSAARDFVATLYPTRERTPTILLQHGITSISFFALLMFDPANSQTVSDMIPPLQHSVLEITSRRPDGLLNFAYVLAFGMIFLIPFSGAYLICVSLILAITNNFGYTNIDPNTPSKTEREETQFLLQQKVWDLERTLNKAEAKAEHAATDAAKLSVELRDQTAEATALRQELVRRATNHTLKENTLDAATRKMASLESNIDQMQMTIRELENNNRDLRSRVRDQNKSSVTHSDQVSTTSLEKVSALEAITDNQD